MKFFSPQALDKQAVLRRPLRHSGPERTRRRVRSERSSGSGHPPCKFFSSPRLHGTLLEGEGDKRRAYASPFSAAHQLHPTLGALPTNFDFDRQERAQAQRTLDNMKALPALGFTLKHDTVSSFVKGLAAYCEQNNIGPLVIENNVGLQVKVWTGDDVYSPYQTDVNGNFQSTESKLRALAKGKPFGRTHYPAANTPFDRLAVGKFLSFDAQMTSLIMEALDDESSPHFPAGLRTTTRNAMHASTQAAGHSVKDQEQARSAHALLCKALQLTSRYAPEVAENVLGRLREMTIQEGSGQLAVFVETFRASTQQNTRLSPTLRRTSGLYSPAPWRDLR